MTTKLHRIKSALRESIEIANKATDGPWTPDRISVWSNETHVCYTSQSDEDSEFLAHARTMTPLACKALLTAIEGLEELAETVDVEASDEVLRAYAQDTEIARKALSSITSEWPDV